ALEKAAEQILKNIPAQAKIAIVYITTQDVSTTEYIVGELEYMWVNQGYFITDRSQLDRLRREQNFQMSGEVDDATAVSIGKFAGANIIVTGSVDGEGDLRRLRLRVLDTQTARVVGAVSEKL
ncbi:MAG: CsgG/HfaB family protein, partial [Spirochaetales bacterium]|nr:CsgG/HfaB family protein [Spirochaetales bacterium]